ncbi:MAG: hypothetical protein AAF652_08150 [Cyanobacteria bacterium P01_C01_bin.72]
MKQDFACIADAKEAANKLSRNWKYHSLGSLEVEQIAHYNTPGRPTKNQSPEHFTYRVIAQVIPVEEAIEIIQRQAGRFILVTNVLNDSILPDD